MQSSSQGRYGYQGYRGYPYVNPMVIDVPSVDPATASRWANLPRRPVQAPGPSGLTPGSSSTGNTSQFQTAEQSQASSDPVPPKKDIDENPVVYIDLPEAGSEVSRSIEPVEDEEPEFVQDTIMYDPFENRRIDMPKEDARSIGSSESESTSEAANPQLNTRPNVNRPNSLNLAGCSASTPGTSRPAPGVPGFMTKESLVYGGHSDDGFPLSPIPISEFPEPPPSYTEVAATPTPTQTQTETRIEPPQPPRTQVIVPDPVSPAFPNTPVGPMNYERKNLICHHCGVRVHTLVVREIGVLTHVIACLLILIFFPLVVIVYLADFFKYKNHYCPNCNKLIGYETPIVGRKVNYDT